MKNEKKIGVIGGGIIGLASALELGKRGFAVDLYEKGKIHRATSANSHRIIHGGLRYLQQGNIPRVVRSLEAKNSCLTDYPEQIVPLKCYLPITGRGLKKSPVLGIAGAFYGALSTLCGYPTEWSGVCPVEQLKELDSLFSNIPQKKIFYWSDARMLDPIALANELKRRAEACGVSIIEDAEVRDVTRQDLSFQVAISSAEEKALDGVVSAVGPWVGTMKLPLSTQVNEESELLWAKAYNLVLKREVVRDEGVGFETARGQVLFFAPRSNQFDSDSQEGRAAVGTWYRSFSGNPDTVSVSEEEVEMALAEVNAALQPPKPLSKSDVVGIECGVLPMKGESKGEPDLLGDEKVVFEDGLVSIMSTKYTTFPVVARKVADYFSSIFPH